jgi:HEAT repeat protein
MGPEIERAVIDLFGSPADSLRAECLIVLRRLSTVRGREFDEYSVEKLTKLMSQTSGSHRCDVIEALGIIGPRASSALPALEKVLTEDAHLSEFYRVHAAVAIVRVGQEKRRSVQLLVDGLQCVSAHVRWMSAEALGSIGKDARDAMPHLREALRDQDPSVRVLAAGAVWRIGGEVADTVPLLARALKEDDRPVYTRPIGISSWELTHRVSAAVYLGEMGPMVAQPAIPALIQAVSDDNKPLQYAAIVALGKLGASARQGRAELVLAAQDPDPTISRAAIEALRKIERETDCGRSSFQ